MKVHLKYWQGIQLDGIDMTLGQKKAGGLYNLVGVSEVGTESQMNAQILLCSQQLITETRFKVC